MPSHRAETVGVPTSIVAQVYWVDFTILDTTAAALPGPHLNINYVEAPSMFFILSILSMSDVLIEFINLICS